MSGHQRAATYEVVALGCATGQENCPNGEMAVTAYELDKDGRRRYACLTVCIKAPT